MRNKIGGASRQMQVFTLFLAHLHHLRTLFLGQQIQPNPLRYLAEHRAPCPLLVWRGRARQRVSQRSASKNRASPNAAASAVWILPSVVPC